MCSHRLQTRLKKYFPKSKPFILWFIIYRVIIFTTTYIVYAIVLVVKRLQLKTIGFEHPLSYLTTFLFNILFFIFYEKEKNH